MQCQSTVVAFQEFHGRPGHVKVVTRPVVYGRSPRDGCSCFRPVQPVHDSASRILYVAVRELSTDRLCLGRGVLAQVAVHQDNFQGHVEPVTDSTHHDNGRNSLGRVQSIDTVQKWSNALVHDECTHASIPGHEIGGTRVFVHEHGGGTHFNGFGNIGSLTRGAGCFVGGKLGWVQSRRGQVGYKGGNVAPVHVSAVFGSDGDGIVDRGTKFSTITRDFVVHPDSKTPEQC